MGKNEKNDWLVVVVVLGFFSAVFGLSVLVDHYFPRPGTKYRDADGHRRNQDQWMKEYETGGPYVLPGKFRVIDKKSGYYKCVGTIHAGGLLGDDLTWFYAFTNLQCGTTIEHPDDLFTQGQIKRLGNLAD